MPSTPPDEVRAPEPRVPTRLSAPIQLTALAAAAVVAALSTGSDNWHASAFVTIAVFSVASELIAVVAASRLIISGSFLGIIIAAVTIGGGPAAAIGVLTIVIGWMRFRESGPSFRNNLVNYAWFPLVAGLVFHAGVNATGATSRSPDFYLLVFVTFVVALALNFTGAAGYQCFMERLSFAGKVRDVLVPVLPAELASALLTLGGVFVFEHAGTMGLLLCVLVFVVYQYLVGEMLTSKRRSDKLQRIATTDELTGLVNREHFRTVVETRIAAANRAGSRFAVLLMDLDHFKEINDTLGHHYGDVLLRDLGPRLVEAIGEGGVVARLGGDEFALLLAQDTDDLSVIDGVISRLLDSIGQPFVVDELSLEVGASVGVARFPHDGEDSHALLRCADIAMYTAKDAQTDYKVYDVEQNQHSLRRLSVISDIRRALSNDEIVVYFQPIVDLDSLQVRGAEGLVRWQHPVHGLVPPGAFVETVEQTGLIGPLTRFVLERSIAACASWRRGGRDMSVAVNLSVRNLLDRDLPREIGRLLGVYGLPPSALHLEITESMIMSDPERALATVGRLSELGVRLSVDDFGTGYSSLANLRKMPIDELKIDRSFVSPMLEDDSDLIIVRSTVNLGHDLGLHVVAEGVEDSATLDHLRDLGCDMVQGYYISRPLPGDSFASWLSEFSLADQFQAGHAGRADVPHIPASIARGALDLAGTTVAAPER